MIVLFELLIEEWVTNGVGKFVEVANISEKHVDQSPRGIDDVFSGVYLYGDEAWTVLWLTICREAF